MPRALFGKSEHEKTFDTAIGAFTLRRPSLYLKQQMHLAAGRMSGGQDIDWAGALDTFMMAQLETYARSDEQIRKVTKDKPIGWPDGFSWEACYDFDVPAKLLSDFTEWVNSFRKQGEPEQGQEGVVGGSPEPGVPVASEVPVAAD